MEDVGAPYFAMAAGITHASRVGTTCSAGTEDEEEDDVEIEEAAEEGEDEDERSIRVTVTFFAASDRAASEPTGDVLSTTTRLDCSGRSDVRRRLSPSVGCTAAPSVAASDVAEAAEVVVVVVPVVTVAVVVEDMAKECAWGFICVRSGYYVIM